MKKHVLSVITAIALAVSLSYAAYAGPALVSKGSSGDVVAEVQQFLKDKGYLSGAVDGIFGNGTFEAVSAFQRDNGLEVTGEVDGETYRVLTSDAQQPGGQADNEGVSPTVDETPSEGLTEASEAEPSMEMVSHPNAVILESDSDIEITKAGFSVDNGMLYCAVVLHNSSDKTAIEFPDFRYTARDADGGILGTQEQVLNIIYPGQDYVWAGIGCDLSGMPATVEFEVVDPEEYNIKDASMLEHPEYIPLVVSNSNCSKDEFLGYKFVGEVYNPNDYDLSSVIVNVVLKDTSGAIVGGELTFIDNVKAGKSVPFELSLMNNIQFSGYELYANSWM